MTTTAATNIPLIGKTRTILFPAAPPARCQIQLGKPGIYILIHGVNDLAGCYAAMEAGLCRGLNERLDHLPREGRKENLTAVIAADYSLPTADDRSAPDPDAVYYRRKHSSTTRGVVIPFYWGFRESDGVCPKTGKPWLQKETPHGEWLDRYGNRLDKAGTKEGGMFANATSNLVDMWGQGFDGMLFGVIPINKLAGTPGHPLFTAPPRNYMILAAKRLAMLIRIIRKKHPDDTVNVMGHSQGTLITLLANAFLKDEGIRPIDSAVLMNSPYSLHEPWMERTQIKHQQTRQARVDTLAGIVNFIGETPHPTPSMAAMSDAKNLTRISGKRWKENVATTTIDGDEVTFNERDNRGNVTFYFTPLDQTVGLQNIQGIGWQGLDDESLRACGSRCYQRIFTPRKRGGVGEKVGQREPNERYLLLAHGEHTWDGNGQGWFGNLSRAALTHGQTVTLNAPKLPVPLEVSFDTESGVVAGKVKKHGIHMVQEHMDPIDASIAITNGGIKSQGVKTMMAPPGMRDPEQLKRYFEEQLEGNDPSRNPYNDPKRNDWAADWHRVGKVHKVGTVYYQLVVYETPNQARERLQTDPLTKADALSFHSSIPMGAEHSRRAAAYDLAIGQARSIDDEAFYAYLCRVADWRLGWGTWQRAAQRPKERSISPQVEKDLDPAIRRNFSVEEKDNKQLIRATDLYLLSGEQENRSSYWATDYPSLVKCAYR